MPDTDAPSPAPTCRRPPAALHSLRPDAAAAPRRRAVVPPAALLALLLAAVLLTTGCGSSAGGDGTEADPATVVPAAAPAYLGATVRPTGSQAQGALAAGQQLTGRQNPYTQLLGLLRTPGSPALSWESDVAPWLGPHAGLFVRSLSGVSQLTALIAPALTGGRPPGLPFGTGKLDGALVMDTKDASAARSFLAAQSRRASAHPASYRGVSYEVTAGGVAFGLVGRFAVIGSEAGLRAVIGAHQGEPALASSHSYSTLLAQAPSDPLAHLYIGPAAAAHGAAAGGLAGLLGGGHPVNVSLSAASGSLAVDVDTLTGAGAMPASPLSADPQAAEALSALPGDSWLAVGLGHAGRQLAADAAAFGVVGSLLGGAGQNTGTLSLGSVLGSLSGPLQVLGANTPQARSDYASWMGPAGIFASGAGILELKAAVVIDSDDAARSRAAVGKLAAALHKRGDAVGGATVAGADTAASVHLSGLPLELVIASGTGSDGAAKFVLGLGEASAQEALAPSSTMSDAPARAAAASALGEGIQPSVVVDVPTMLALLESIGLTDEQSLSQVLPYLRAAGTLAGGGRSLGSEAQRFRVVLSLHHG